MLHYRNIPSGLFFFFFFLDEKTMRTFPVES